MLDTGMKTKLKIMYMPLTKEFDTQPDDNIIRNTKKVLDIEHENARNNEKLEDRISRITRKARVSRGKTKPLIGEFYSNAATNATTRTRPNMKQDSRPESKSAQK